MELERVAVSGTIALELLIWTDVAALDGGSLDHVDALSIRPDSGTVAL